MLGDLFECSVCAMYESQIYSRVSKEELSLQSNESDRNFNIAKKHDKRTKAH